MYYHNVGMRGSRGGGGSRGPDPPPHPPLGKFKFQNSIFIVKLTKKEPYHPPPLSLENISGSAHCWSEEILNLLQYSGSLYSVTVRPSMIDYS